MTLVEPLITVPLERGGARKMALTPDGLALVFTDHGEGSELPPDIAFTHPHAIGLARLVLAGHERTVTAPDTLRVLAAALLLLDRQMSAPPTPSEPADAPAGDGEGFHGLAAEVLREQDRQEGER